MSGLTLPRTIEWIGGIDGWVRMIDQTRLPDELVFLECHDVGTMWEAIRNLRVRGAPAIGVTAAMGAVLGVRGFSGDDRTAFLNRLDEVCLYLETARPTAVNLFWALGRVRGTAGEVRGGVAAMTGALWQLAQKIRDEDEIVCRAIGRHGASLIADGCGVLTHCNAGSLATAYFGTALAPLYTAHLNGCRFRVYVDETRPLLQGSRLTMWELMQAGIDATLLCDSMAAALMKQRKIDLVMVGADRIAANGDTANKIGTYGLAVLARAHEIPFYVAAPTSTFDLSLRDGNLIPIEERHPDEIRMGFGKPTAPPNAKCFCPAFDVTPAGLISAILTEGGFIRPVNEENIAATIGG